jgi:putative phosphoesterase
VKIGLIADTHLPALFRTLDGLGPQAADFLRQVDLILHAGDVTAPSVLDWLEQFAPVLAARGNNDDFHDPRLKPVQCLDLLGWRIGMAHNLVPETRPLPEINARHFDGAAQIMIAGHTHLERIRAEDGLLLVNPGSPILPHHRETRLGCVGLLELSPDAVRAEIVVLGETPGRANPCRAQALHFPRPAVSA